MLARAPTHIIAMLVVAMISHPMRCGLSTWPLPTNRNTPNAHWPMRYPTHKPIRCSPTQNPKHCLSPRHRPIPTHKAKPTIPSLTASGRLFLRNLIMLRRNPLKYQYLTKMYTTCRWHFGNILLYKQLILL